MSEAPRKSISMSEIEDLANTEFVKNEEGQCTVTLKQYVVDQSQRPPVVKEAGDVTYSLNSQVIAQIEDSLDEQIAEKEREIEGLKAAKSNAVAIRSKYNSVMTGT